MLVPKDTAQIIPQAPTLLSETLNYRFGIYAGGILFEVPQSH